MGNKFQIGQNNWKSAIGNWEAEVSSLENHKVCISGEQTRGNPGTNLTK